MAGVAWMDGVLRAPGSRTRLPGLYLAGGSTHPRPGGADGGAIGPARGAERERGPCFDETVVPGGYQWWYIDALSDDGSYGLTAIAFIGSVFSPYYAWSGRKDPLQHCAMNVALYGPTNQRWAMTERGANAVTRSKDILAIGPSSLSWDKDALTIHVDEIATPFPRRIRGNIRVEPIAINSQSFLLEAHGRHFWRPSRHPRACRSIYARRTCAGAVAAISILTTEWSRSNMRFPNGHGCALACATARRFSTTRNADASCPFRSRYASMRLADMKASSRRPRRRCRQQGGVSRVRQDQTTEKHLLNAALRIRPSTRDRSYRPRSAASASPPCTKACRWIALQIQSCA